MLNALFARMTADISPLVMELHKTRTALFDLVEAEKDRKAKIPPASRDTDQVLQILYQKLIGARTAFAHAEAALEKAQADHGSYIAMASLLAAYTQAGKDATAVEQAIAQVLGMPQTPPAQQAPVQQYQPPVQQAPVQQAPPVQQYQQPAQGVQQNTGTEAAVFTVLETRAGKSPALSGRTARPGTARSTLSTPRMA